MRKTFRESGDATPKDGGEQGLRDDLNTQYVGILLKECHVTNNERVDTHGDESYARSGRCAVDQFCVSRHGSMRRPSSAPARCVAGGRGPQLRGHQWRHTLHDSGYLDRAP